MLGCWRDWSILHSCTPRGVSGGGWGQGEEGGIAWSALLPLLIESHATILMTILLFDRLSLASLRPGDGSINTGETSE